MDCAGAEYTVCKQLLIPITNWRQAILEWSCGELTVCIRRQRLISWTPSVTTRTIWQTEDKNIPSYWCSLHNPNPNTKSIQSSSFCEMLIEHNVHHNSHSFYSDLSIHSTTDTGSNTTTSRLEGQELTCSPISSWASSADMGSPPTTDMEDEPSGRIISERTDGLKTGCTHPEKHRYT